MGGRPLFATLTVSLLLCVVGRITDFEYTVECAVFDMLDIALVHGWLLDDQDANTVRAPTDGDKPARPDAAASALFQLQVVQNKSYNELVAHLVEYRSVLMTEGGNESSETTQNAPEPDTHEPSTPASEGATESELETKTPPPVPVASMFTALAIDTEMTDASESALSSPLPRSSPSTPKKSPSKQTVQVMMKERHISDADALSTATVLLEDGPVLEDFFNSSASQLTYYGLLKLHEGVRERQLCVFFRNNHFSTLFKVRCPHIRVYVCGRVELTRLLPLSLAVRRLVVPARHGRRVPGRADRRVGAAE